ncbi:MAG: low molecular weight phosphotyrosine protein phosphatase [Nitrospira sp.]|nr:low molecular weight phosphotyrosine protein phosphatase [Nitrospira sp.]
MMTVASQIKKGVVDLYWTLRGTTIPVPVLPLQPRSVLFVCKGNICRSPFAEQVARKLVHEQMGNRGEPIAFRSAGLHVTTSKTPPDMALSVARRFGVSLDNHRSQPISHELVATSDIIIAMEGWHYDELRLRFTGCKEKVFLLALFAKEASARFGYEAFNIPDPYGGSQQIFEQCFEKIEQSVKTLLAELQVKR